MRIFKSNPLLRLGNSYLVDSSQPSNISYAWNFGSLLAFCLIIQIVSGVTLAMHYNASVLDAFHSVEHVMRDVNNGWLIRYFHSNTASAFFFLVYLHIGRGLYFGSYKAPRTLVWTIGTVIFILMMAIAFLGYVLPYGQMSLWGATVITSLMSAIPWVGQDIVEFIWGGFSVNNATLNRFFALHFVLPFVLAALVLMHLIVLHESAGSGNPLGVSGSLDRIPFAPYYIFKDLITIFIFILVLSVFVFFMPNVLGDSENYVMANPMQTPPAIVPEWYLLPFYAILRSIPNKLLGVIAMFSAILILLVMPFTDLSRSRGIQFRPLSKIAFFFFLGNFLILMELGAKHVESPFIEFGQSSTVFYFSYFLVIIPFVSLLENSLIELATMNKESASNETSNVILYHAHSLNSVFHLHKLFFNYVNTSAIFFVNNKKRLLSLSLNVTLILLYLSGQFSHHLLNDAPRPWGIYFQDSGTPQMEGLVELHDNILFYLVIILFAVIWILISILRINRNVGASISHRHIGHGTFVELVWTITPALILMLITFPSFKLLFLMDEVSDPAMAVLAEGHQWYWSYQYPDFIDDNNDFIEFDSYLVPEPDLENGGLRMLEVDSKLIIPELTHVRFLVTAADVIHSFACPSLGVKCDAYPGRLNHVSVMLNREGLFFGQCSEICGILHSSMPIVIESISVDKFVSWLTTYTLIMTTKRPSISARKHTTTRTSVRGIANSVLIGCTICVSSSTVAICKSISLGTIGAGTLGASALSAGTLGACTLSASALSASSAMFLSYMPDSSVLLSSLVKGMINLGSWLPAEYWADYILQPCAKGLWNSLCGLPDTCVNVKNYIIELANPPTTYGCDPKLISEQKEILDNLGESGGGYEESEEGEGGIGAGGGGGAGAGGGGGNGDWGRLLNFENYPLNYEELFDRLDGYIRSLHSRAEENMAVFQLPALPSSQVPSHIDMQTVLHPFLDIQRHFINHMGEYLELLRHNEVSTYAAENFVRQYEASIDILNRLIDYLQSGDYSQIAAGLFDVLSSLHPFMESVHVIRLHVYYPGFNERVWSQDWWNTHVHRGLTYPGWRNPNILDDDLLEIIRQEQEQTRQWALEQLERQAQEQLEQQAQEQQAQEQLRQERTQQWVQEQLEQHKQEKE